MALEEGELAVRINCVVAMNEPVANIDVERFMAIVGDNLPREWGVTMSEDAEIDGFLLEALLLLTGSFSPR